MLTWEGEAAENLPIWIHVCYSFRRIHLPGDIVYVNVAERVIPVATWLGTLHVLERHMFRVMHDSVSGVQGYGFSLP